MREQIDSQKQSTREKTLYSQHRKTSAAIALGAIPYDNYARYDVEFAMQKITAAIVRLTPSL
jgi:hypothetical protein